MQDVEEQIADMTTGKDYRVVAGLGFGKVGREVRGTYRGLTRMKKYPGNRYMHIEGEFMHHIIDLDFILEIQAITHRIDVY